ncbi:MAG: hypothetical protein COB56_01055 [Robiginitomaculum sp.]|nr:MAG: hypothetical protein COB56_01055 [Robiginitomaculum sp.]
MALLGIITGLVGSVATNAFSWLTLKEKNRYAIEQMSHKEKRWVYEKDLVKLKSQGKVSEFEMQAFLKQVDGSYKNLEASIKAQIASGKKASVFSNSIVTLFRPFLTVLLVVAMFYYSKITYGSGQSNEAYGILAIIDLASMAVSWWFGDRSIKRGIQNIMGAGNVRAAGGDF